MPGLVAQALSCISSHSIPNGSMSVTYFTMPFAQVKKRGLVFLLCAEFLGHSFSRLEKLGVIEKFAEFHVTHYVLAYLYPLKHHIVSKML